jgi:AcrR family transcriptional regulator
MKVKSESGKPRASIGAQRNPDSAVAILKAAEAILRREGYSGFSIEKVARLAQAGKPTIYRWWPNKVALLLDVYLNQKIIDYPDTGNLEDDLTLFVLAIFKFWRETSAGTIFRSIIAESQTDAAASDVFSKFAADRRIETAGIIRRAQRRGEMGQNIQAELIADWIASWLWSHLLTNRLTEDEIATRKAIQVLTQGILK